MVHQELERRFLPELLHITRSAPLSEFQAQSWFRNLLVRAPGWSENCLLWQGTYMYIIVTQYCDLLTLFLNSSSIVRNIC